MIEPFRYAEFGISLLFGLFILAIVGIMVERDRKYKERIDKNERQYFLDKARNQIVLRELREDNKMYYEAFIHARDEASAKAENRTVHSLLENGDMYPPQKNMIVVSGMSKEEYLQERKTFRETQEEFLDMYHIPADWVSKTTTIGNLSAELRQVLPVTRTCAWCGEEKVNVGVCLRCGGPDRK